MDRAIPRLRLSPRLLAMPAAATPTPAATPVSLAVSFTARMPDLRPRFQWREFSIADMGNSIAAATAPAFAPPLTADFAPIFSADARPADFTAAIFRRRHVSAAARHVLDAVFQNDVAGQPGLSGRVRHGFNVAELFSIQEIPNGVLAQVANRRRDFVFVQTPRHRGRSIAQPAPAQSAGYESPAERGGEIIPRAPRPD